jgi:hypothetical protein
MSSSSPNEFITAAGVHWDDPEEGKTWLVSLISIVTLAALVIFLSVVYFRGESAEHTVKFVDTAYTSMQSRKSAQLELLTRSGPYSAEVGGKQVSRQRQPIGKAMESLVANPRLALPPASASTASSATPEGDS